MVKLMSDIEIKINELFDELEKSKTCKDYIKVKKQLENDTEIMSLIDEIKRYQKIATNNKDKFLEEKLKNMYIKLESYPIYQSYLIIKESLNEELFIIKETFEKYFKDILKL